MYVYSGTGTHLKAGGTDVRSGAKVGGTDPARRAGEKHTFFGRAPQLFWL